MKHSKILAITLGLCLSLLLALPLYAGDRLQYTPPDIAKSQATFSTTREAPVIPDELQAYGPAWPTVSNTNVHMCDPFSESSDVWDVEVVGVGWGQSSAFAGSGLECDIINVPTGALAFGMEIEACDVDPNDEIVVTLIQFPGPAGIGGLIFHTSYGTGVAATPGCGYFQSGFPAFTVDNFNNTYGYEILDYNPYGNGTNFRVARLLWLRQISPPPGTPTFNDVNTSDWFYQGVEALAFAGITTGCGGGNFCPNVAVTRAQMAVFLARALGLHWPY